MLKDSIKTIALSLITLSLLSIAYAWTEPALTPPSGNTSTPLNTSGTAQIKTGGLWLNSGGASSGLIVENGNVGIGTTSPGQKLDVNGGWLRVSGTAGPNGDTATRIGVYDTDNAGGVSGWWISQNQDGKFSIHQNEVGDRFNIDGSGNVGIGTTSPGQKLEICDQGTCAYFSIIHVNKGEDSYTTQDLGCGRSGSNTNTTYGTYMGQTATYYQCTVDDNGKFYTNRFWTSANICQCGCEVVYLSNCLIGKRMHLTEE